MEFNQLIHGNIIITTLLVLHAPMFYKLGSTHKYMENYKTNKGDLLYMTKFLSPEWILLYECSILLKTKSHHI